ncbi:HNH endonuclease signature motif containing protein [Nocardioides marmoribigeumensis]|uniref:DUF222 domain-containing protein n=1 Tax=Nocardioides marmoribigeumensis TaxID=433649 RepID=A0ABU2BYD1_9ACTN|nr:DUF222 domain-containing protein [Nocardioides marmoribigeumensis]MDR7363408.1 hypothetical protein [Nocardioides marmoribigeumensis]
MTATAGFTAPAPEDLTSQGRGWRRGVLLSGVRAEQRTIEAAEARKLSFVTEWADLHRADQAALDGDTLEPASVPVPASVGLGSLPILMSGVPVEEYCVTELATALRTSHAAARSLTEDALELRGRLPRCWARVHAGELSAWKARTVAQQTRTLPEEAADWVDRNLAPFAASLSVTRIKNAVAAAVLRFDPDRAAAEAEAASDKRGVWFDYEHGSAELPTDDARPDGTGRLDAVASIPDLRALDDTLDEVAAELKILGDESSHQVRRSKALGIIADPQHAIDLSHSADQALDAEAEPDASGEPVPRRRPNRARSPLGVERPIHLHLHTSTDVARIQASGLPHAASPISRAAVEQWLADLAPGTRVKVTPVIDLNHHHAVDAYEAPDHLRALVDERDHGCVFPYCTNQGRYDLDHTDPFLDPDDGGPPGQTSNHNLAKLCRHHHRAKTHGHWTYRRITDPWDLDIGWPEHHRDEQHADPPPVISADDRGGPPAAYRWDSPLGHAYLVTATGTYPLD